MVPIVLHKGSEDEVQSGTLVRDYWGRCSKIAGVIAWVVMLNGV